MQQLLYVSLQGVQQKLDHWVFHLLLGAALLVALVSVLINGLLLPIINSEKMGEWQELACRVTQRQVRYCEEGTGQQCNIEHHAAC
jgi:uncharacterized membrane protein